MMSEVDIEEYNKLIEKLELSKRQKTRVAETAELPHDKINKLEEEIKLLEFRNEKLHEYNNKLIEEVRSLRSKLYIKEN
tara:strand:- start:69 stop:305 length:237 start_codon:yes stop_codon:yes gene_type:complete